VARLGRVWKFGSYFQQADIFVFPTFEDIWGMVALEAMIFGKPVVCSKWAGAVEMVSDGTNGYIFDPYNSQELASVMCRFIDEPELINSMGNQSQQLIEQTIQPWQHNLLLKLYLLC
jgi:glycosyltransferase involved in cell wall biosynthesis